MGGAFNMVTPPFVSVVVPTYNRRDSLKSTIESLLAQDYPSFEVIVVDDGSSDGTFEFLKGLSSARGNLKPLSQANRGPSAARNLGLGTSGSEIVCFTDDDCIADRDWIKNLVAGFTVHDVGGVGGEVVTYQPSTLAEKYAEEAGLLRQEKYYSMKFLITANVAYRREVLNKVGGFDTELRACEDLDLSIRAQMGGYKIAYAPSAVVYHKHRLGLKDLFRQQYRNGIGLARLNRKYPKDFKLPYNCIVLKVRILAKALGLPLALVNSFLRGGGRYAVVKPFYDIVVLSSNLLGMMEEGLFGRRYPGSIHAQKLPFVEDQSFGALLRKIRFKLV